MQDQFDAPEFDLLDGAGRKKLQEEIVKFMDAHDPLFDESIVVLPKIFVAYDAAVAAYRENVGSPLQELNDPKVFRWQPDPSLEDLDSGEFGRALLDTGKKYAADVEEIRDCLRLRDRSKSTTPVNFDIGVKSNSPRMPSLA